MDSVVSIEDLSDQLSLVVAQIAVESQLPPPLSATQHVLAARLAVQLISGDQTSAKATAETIGLGPEAVDEAREELSVHLEDFRHWCDRVLHESDEKVLELARRIIGEAEHLKVSVGHVLSRLQQHVIGALVEDNVLLPFPVHTTTGTVTFDTSKVSVTSNLKIAPSLKAPTEDEVIDLLASLFSLELDIAVEYDPPSSGKDDSSSK